MILSRNGMKCANCRLTGNKDWSVLVKSLVRSFNWSIIILCPTGQFNVLIVPLQKWLAKVTPRLSVSEPVYGNKDTVERLIDSHQVSISSSDNSQS